MKRNEHDHYRDTPEVWATEQLVQRLAGLKRPDWYSDSTPLRILEPCNGTGNIGRTLQRIKPREWDIVTTNDIDPRHQNDFCLDAANASLYDPRPDWIVTNPPFNLAPILIPIFVREARHGVACILRLTYLEPTQNRGVWLQENPPAAVWTMPRMSFTGDGKTDSVTAAWFVWVADADDPDVELDALPLQPIMPATAGARLLP